MASTPRPARESIMDHGLRLFNAQGYHGTGIKQILDAAGVPKGSFYHHFDSKEQFALAIIERYRQQQQFADPEPASLPQDALTELKELFQQNCLNYKQADHIEMGCLAVNLAAELANSSDALCQALNRFNTDQVDALQQRLSRAQQQGVIRDDLNAKQLANLCWSVWQGGLLQMKLSRNIHPLSQVIALIFEQLLPSGPTR